MRPSAQRAKRGLGMEPHADDSERRGSVRAAEGRTEKHGERESNQERRAHRRGGEQDAQHHLRYRASSVCHQCNLSAATMKTAVRPLTFSPSALATGRRYLLRSGKETRGETYQRVPRFAHPHLGPVGDPAFFKTLPIDQNGKRHRELSELVWFCDAWKHGACLLKALIEKLQSNGQTVLSAGRAAPVEVLAIRWSRSSRCGGLGPILSVTIVRHLASWLIHVSASLLVRECPAHTVSFCSASLPREVSREGETQDDEPQRARRQQDDHPQVASAGRILEEPVSERGAAVRNSLRFRHRPLGTVWVARPR